MCTEENYCTNSLERELGLNNCAFCVCVYFFQYKNSNYDRFVHKHIVLNLKKNMVLIQRA